MRIMKESGLEEDESEGSKESQFSVPAKFGIEA